MASLLNMGNAAASKLIQKFFPLESTYDDPWKKRLFDRMIEEEGYRLLPYTDRFSSAKGELQGVGHLNTGDRPMGLLAWPGEASEQLQSDIDEKIGVIQGMFPERYDSMDSGMREALVDMAFRGDIKSNNKFVKLLKEGRRDAAADEYLNHAGYRRSKKAGTGIHKRMERNAELLRKRK